MLAEQPGMKPAQPAMTSEPLRQRLPERRLIAVVVRVTSELLVTLEMPLRMGPTMFDPAALATCGRAVHHSPLALVATVHPIRACAARGQTQGISVDWATRSVLGTFRRRARRDDFDLHEKESVAAKPLSTYNY